MIRPLTIFLGILLVLSGNNPSVQAADPARPEITIVLLGDSITKGVRTGVSLDQTFGAVCERELRAQGIPVRVINLGIGGENTAQARNRLADVLRLKPAIVTLMYGTNDSYVDIGKKESRISVADYRQNLKAMIADLKKQGALPILMTEPRWSADSDKNGLGENPNPRLAPYMEACRTLATEAGIPLVDHFQVWTQAEARGQDLRPWTTDGCHPNPEGHRLLAESLVPVLLNQRAVVLGQGAQTPGLKKVEQLLISGEPFKAVCLGDSVTGIYYHTGGRRAYPELFEIGLKQAYPGSKPSVINAGISGETTSDALARLDRDVLKHRPKLVTVAFGLNDITRVPIETYRANLRTIVERCRAIGAEVILCTPNNVITTPSRPVTTLEKYCETVREVGKDLNTSVCDFYATLESLRKLDPTRWRLWMSDEIHPNLHGHARMAETLVSTMGRPTSLANLPVQAPFLPHVRAKLQARAAIRVLAMPPYDEWISLVVAERYPGAVVNVTRWPVDGLSLEQLEADARSRVRAFRPDLVVVAVPTATPWPASAEAGIHSYAWLLNNSLSFGLADWDCLVVHPSIAEGKGAKPAPTAAYPEHSELLHRLTSAQDLLELSRTDRDQPVGKIRFESWLRELLRD